MLLALPKKCSVRDEEKERTKETSLAASQEGLFELGNAEGDSSAVRSFAEHDEGMFPPADPELDGPIATTVVDVGKEDGDDGSLRALEHAMEETDEADEIASEGMDPELEAELFGKPESVREEPGKQVGGLALPKKPSAVDVAASQAIALPTPRATPPEPVVDHVDRLLGAPGAAVAVSNKRKRQSKDEDDQESAVEESERPAKKPTLAVKYRCRYGCCGLISGITTLRSHMQNVHNLFYGEPVGTCKDCGKKFACAKKCNAHALKVPMCHGENVKVHEEWDVPVPRTAQARADTWGLKADGEISRHLIVYPRANGTFPSTEKLPALPIPSNAVDADRPDRKDSQHSNLAQTPGSFTDGPILIDDDNNDNHVQAKALRNSGNPIVIDDNSKAEEVAGAVLSEPRQRAFHDSEEELHRALAGPFDMDTFLASWFGKEASINVGQEDVAKTERGGTTLRMLRGGLWDRLSGI